MKKKPIFLCLFVLLLLGFSACSSDDDSSSGPSSTDDLGSTNFVVTGDFEAEKSGFADFASLDLGSISTWEISTHDYSPQTFSLNFMLTSATNEVAQPEPGTYTIGFETNSTEVFHVVYTRIDDGDFSSAVEYTTWDSDSGTLTIQSATENQVTGSYDFTAYYYDDAFNKTSEIQVSGEFAAKKRIN
ncbi:MAG: hypothetical protein ACQESK_00575 [Bacteroidota bacterium]